MQRFKPLSWALGVLTIVAMPTGAAACTVNTGGVAFGSYDPGSATSHDGIGTLTVTCHPRDRSPMVSLGTGSGGSYGSRAMANGADRLNYNLFTDVARTSVWGDGTSGTATITLTGGTVNGGERHFQRSIYGRIPPSQRVRARAYSDTMVITITF